MVNNEIQSSLQMLGLYFSKYSVDLNGTINNGVLKNTINVSYANKPDDKYHIKIQIDLTLEDEKGSFKLFLQTLGFFKLEKDECLSDELADEILKKNTVAIMFPFIRSQVSLLTTQPGMSPVLLQPIDVNALLKNQ